MRRFGTGICAGSAPRAASWGMSETILDVKGMNCPLPVLRANRKLRELPVGGLLTADRLRGGLQQRMEQCVGRRIGTAVTSVIEQAPPGHRLGVGDDVVVEVIKE